MQVDGINTANHRTPQGKAFSGLFLSFSSGMPFTHHSHSGQFCSHGKNTLEEIIKSAIDRKFIVFALTEHMPREQSDLYPEEVNTSPISLCARLTLGV